MLWFFFTRWESPGFHICRSIRRFKGRQPLCYSDENSAPFHFPPIIALRYAPFFVNHSP
jgi:hypothetical protein